MVAIRVPFLDEGAIRLPHLGRLGVGFQSEYAEIGF
jgi:hypothetical protein